MATYPNFQIDDSFSEEAWASLITGKDSRVTGSCRLCGTTFGGSIAHIMGQQGLPRCPNAACETHGRLQVEADEPIDDADQEAPEPAPPRMLAEVYKNDFHAVMIRFARYFPDVRLSDDLMTEEGWKASIRSSTSDIQVTCLKCNTIKVCKAGNTIGAGQGFCHECRFFESSFRKAIKSYGGQFIVMNPHMAPEGDGEGQNYLHIDVECLSCSWTGTISTRSQSKCKRCNKTERWSGEVGYGNFMKLISHYKDTRFYKPVLTLAQWKQQVKNNNTQVPIQCALCDETREVRLSNIQQGGSVGCGCVRSVVAFEDELKKILPSVSIFSEVSLQNLLGGKLLDFAIFVDSCATANRRQYLMACKDIEITPMEQTPRIAFEVDGRQHFTGIIYGAPNPAISERDLEKDLIACEKGYTLIRIQQMSIWKASPHWRDYVKSAISYAMMHPEGGQILCEDVDDYISESVYAIAHEGTSLAEVFRTPALLHGIVRKKQ